MKQLKNLLFSLVALLFATISSGQGPANPSVGSAGGITVVQGDLHVKGYTYLAKRNTLSAFTRAKARGGLLVSIPDTADANRILPMYWDGYSYQKVLLTEDLGLLDMPVYIDSIFINAGVWYYMRNDTAYEIGAVTASTAFGSLTGAVYDQINLRDTFLTRMRYSDTLNLSSRIDSKADTGLVWKIGGNYNINSSSHFIGPINRTALRFKIGGFQVGLIANDSSAMNPRFIVGFGHNVLKYHNLSSGSNIAIGAYSLSSLASGGGYIAIGDRSLQSVAAGSINATIAIGNGSMQQVVSAPSGTNIAIGPTTLFQVQGGQNIAIGPSTMYSLQAGFNNIGIGSSTLYTSKFSKRSIAIGDSTLNKVRSSDNIAIGYYALRNLDSLTADLGGVDYGNLAIGNWAMTSTTTGTRSTAIGNHVLEYNTTGSINVGIGERALYYNTAGSQNFAGGVNALFSNTSGIKNVASGAGALENNTTGSFNVADGQDALLNNTTGSGNIGIGWNGFANNYTGHNNIGIGYGAGKSITHGNYNVIIGRDAAWQPGLQKDTNNASIIIGWQAYATEDSVVVLGANLIKKTHLKGKIYGTNYGTGANTGTPAYYLAVNSSGQFIEVAAPVLGLEKGTTTISNNLSNRILYDSSGVLSSEDNFKWNYASNRLEVMGEYRMIDPTNSSRGVRIWHEAMSNKVTFSALGSHGLVFSGFTDVTLGTNVSLGATNAQSLTLNFQTSGLTPLKFPTSGAVLNTTAVAGGMEVLVDSIYYTGASSVRRRLAFADEIAGGGSMVYPGAGIAVSTGSAWGTSIVDNSSNWNTAYGWGNHAGLYPTISRFTDSLLNHTSRFNSITGFLAAKADTGILLTINGTAQSLGTNRTWTLGTGNYGNLPVNRNGILTTPGSDSLDFDLGLNIKGQLSATNFLWAGNSSYPYLELKGNDPLIYFGSAGAASPSIGKSGGVLSLYGNNVAKRINLYSYLGGPGFVSFYDNGTSRSANFLKTSIYVDTIIGGASDGSIMGNAYIGDSTSMGTGNSGHMFRAIARQGYNAASLNTFYSTIRMGNVNVGATQGHGVSFQHDFIKTGANTLDIMYGAAFLMDSIIAGTVNKRYGLKYWDAWVNGGARLGYQSALIFEKLKAAAVGLNAHILADSSDYAQLDGNMYLGDSLHASGARKAFHWFNGTAPTSSISGAIVWAEGGELKARDASGNITTLTDPAGGSMVYPGAGIAVSTGSAWGTSITDNSTNWNTAYGWGNHAGLYPTTSRFLDSLLAHTSRFNGVTSSLALKLNISDTASKTWDWGDITGKPSVTLNSDTASMLGGYTRVTRFLDSLANHTTRFNGVTSSLALKLNISDTASKTWDWADITGKPSLFLASDTASKTWAWTDITGKPNIVLVSDTASMLNNYVRRQELKDTAAAIRSAIGTGGSGVTTIGAINGISKSANGLGISGNTLYAQTVDATHPGLMAADMYNRLMSNSYIQVTKRTGYDSLGWFKNDSTLYIKAIKFNNGTNTTVSTSVTDSTLDVTINATGGAGVSDGDKGDVTVSGSGATWTVDNGTITLAKMADIATGKVIGRTTAGTGAPEAVDAAIINLTSPVNGEVLKYSSSGNEWVNKNPYYDYWQRINSDYTAANTTSSQSIFPSTSDAVTLEASTTYEFEMFMWVTNGTTTATKGLTFNGGTVTFTDFAYGAMGQNVAVNTTGTTQSTAYSNTAANTVILATGTTSWFIKAKGTFRTNAAGTFIPQFKFSADPTGTILVKAGTWFGIKKIGTSSLTNIGGWN